MKSLGAVDDSGVLDFDLLLSRIVCVLLAKHRDSVVAENKFRGRVLECRTNFLVNRRVAQGQPNISGEQQVIGIAFHIFHKIDELGEDDGGRYFGVALVRRKHRVDSVKIMLGVRGIASSR